MLEWIINVLRRFGNRHTITPEAVAWAYRLFLDREAENRQVIDDKVKRFTTTRELRNEFFHADEFLQKNPGLHSPTLSGFEPRMSIEEMISQPEQVALFMHIQETWQRLGETEPYWSVLTADQFRQTHIQNGKEAFYNSGQADVDRILKTLDRNGIDSAFLKSCLEYGCGLGRVTRWLANKFETVVACDISQPHLKIAHSYLADEGISNTSLIHIRHVDDIFSLPRVDLIYSVIVLQHNPPPLIALIIKQFVTSLNPGGVALFQVPTYRVGYQFSLKQYLNAEAKEQAMEMHVFPQRKVFEIVKQEGGNVIEVQEDGWTGSRHQEVSNTFLVQKE